MIKLPEPSMFLLQAKDGRLGNNAYSVKSHAESAVADNPPHIGYKVVGVVAEAQLKQAMRDVLEEAAKECEKTPKFDAYSAGLAVQDHCANKIRKLKEQL